ncbi:MAG: ABC transporter permease [Candidatus Kariarchaeaceae archaeon]
MSKEILENEEIREAGIRLLGSGLLFIVIYLISKSKNIKINRVFIYSFFRGTIQLIALASIFGYLLKLKEIIPLFIVLSASLFT